MQKEGYVDLAVLTMLRDHFYQSQETGKEEDKTSIHNR